MQTVDQHGFVELLAHDHVAAHARGHDRSPHLGEAELRGLHGPESTTSATRRGRGERGRRADPSRRVQHGIGRLAQQREHLAALAHRQMLEPGLVAAAPIRDPAGRVIAARYVSAPAFRFDHRLDAAALRIVEAADALSLLLGGGPTPLPSAQDGI